MIKNEDHVSLVLPTTVTINQSAENRSGIQRKKCRRYWNQLPRCQKNLIILLSIVLCIAILLYITGDENIKSLKGSDKNIWPEKSEESQSQSQIKRTTAVVQNHHQSLNKPIDRILFKKFNSHRNETTSANSNARLMSRGNVAKATLQRHNTDSGNGNDNDDGIPLDFKGPKNDRQKAIVDSFKHSWDAYKRHAWGHDNLKPITMGSHDWFGLGLTIVDSLDTMYIMNLREEFDEARNWIDNYLNFNINRDVNVFEVTIRVLGGLLSAYHLSKDKMFLQKSIDLGERLLPSFNSPSGIPYSDINLSSKQAHSPKWSPDSSTSEVTTIQLEFRDLTYCSGIETFEKMAQQVNEKVHSLEKTCGLVPIFINANTGTFRNFATISLGARGDSYYEYLLKQWLQTGRKPNDNLIQDYKTSIDGVIQKLVRKTTKNHLTFIGELIHGTDFKPKMDHLTCYLPGTLLLGYKYGNMPETHLNLAIELLNTCYQTYIQQPTGLAPEITYFNIKDITNDNNNDDNLPGDNGNPNANANDIENDDIQVKSNDAHNLLRPEFIESLYYFYAITRNKTYQEWGWNIFKSFEKYTKVDTGGYTSIGNVQNVHNPRPRDMMESFWLSETLKYLYLLFSDDSNINEINLEKYVFNTEAHPLPIINNNNNNKNKRKIINRKGNDRVVGDSNSKKRVV